MSVGRVAGVLVSVGFLVGCMTAPPPTPTPLASPLPFSGGTLRIVTPAHAEDQGFGRFGESPADPGALDPHRDWPAPYDSVELYRCCLARTLLSTNGRAVDLGGSRLQPDVAESLPEISADGLTWTFRLQVGLRYAPPLEEVEITAQDFIRSFHRLMAPGWSDDYWPSLYEDVVGAAEFRAGTASSISGFTSPDPHTLVIRLTEPKGDLAARLATLVIPIPANPANPQSPFGIADGHDDDFGRFAVSSGPYMIEGTPELDFTIPPEDRPPVSGFVPGARVALVRNPSWEPETDSLRLARPARIELEVVETLEDGIGRINAATADVLVNAEVPDEVVADVGNDPNLGRVYINEGGTLVGLTMKTAMPPFDDIHVRRAVNHVVNKAAALTALGGSLHYRVAYHIAPDSLEDNLLLDYRPYGGPSGTGNVEAAKAEMKQSRYDTNQDGICDAAVCQSVATAVGTPELESLIREDLMQIGITVVDGSFNTFAAYTDPTVKAALYIPQGWGRDYLSASNFFVGQFHGPTALAGDGNASLVGASPEQLADWGYGVTETPNVDARIEPCIPLTGAAQFECWATLDQYMMENVASFVPLGEGVVPILTSSRVTEYSWDELATAPAYDRIEVSPATAALPDNTGGPGVEQSSSARPSLATTAPTMAIDPEIEGLWETERLTRDTMAATLSAAELDPGLSADIAENEGMDEYVVYQVEISGGRWTIRVFPDGEPAGVGWAGTYEIMEPGTVTATDDADDCTLTYEYEASDDELIVDLIDDPCGEDDVPFQTVIFESSPFTRIE